MRVLCAYRTGVNANPFVAELVKALENVGVYIKWSLEDFWAIRGEYDIVHIHWPEHLYYYSDIIELEVLEIILLKWKEKSKIVMTRHNRMPHHRGDQKIKVYEKVYKSLDGMVHLGSCSYHEVIKLKPLFNNTIIPHHIYDRHIKLSNNRKKINTAGNYVLVFGRVRFEKERDMILNASKYLKSQKIKVVVPFWRTFNESKKKKPISWLIFQLTLLFENIFTNLKSGNSYVTDKKMLRLFSNSLFVLVPRIDSLNSGVVPQAFTFQKVCVGVNQGNIGEILEETGNPTFVSGDNESLFKALDLGCQLSENGHGVKNYQYARKHLNGESIAKRYQKFFQSL